MIATCIIVGGLYLLGLAFLVHGLRNAPVVNDHDGGCVDETEGAE